MTARFILGVDVLNLFARLRKLSTKLSLTSAGKPRDSRQPISGDLNGVTAPADRRDRISAIESRRRRIRGGRASSTDIAADLYPTNSPTSNLPKSAPRLTQNAASEETAPAVTPSKKSATSIEKRARSPFLTAVGTSMGWVGAAVARPFQGAKPLHKNRLFWAGSGLGLGLLGLAGAWIFVDRSVSQYDPADALSYVRPGTITIKGLNGSILLQTGNATRETLKVWQMPDKLKKAFVAIEDRRFY